MKKNCTFSRCSSVCVSVRACYKGFGQETVRYLSNYGNENKLTNERSFVGSQLGIVWVIESASRRDTQRFYACDHNTAYHQ